jgi:hypothetical protein
MALRETKTRGITLKGWALSALLSILPVGAAAQQPGTWASGGRYDNGYFAAVGTSYGGVGPVVEVHQAAGGAGPLWYRVGIPGKSPDYAVSWRGSKEYDTGSNPDVAVHNKTVVEVHQGKSGKLWYHVGHLNATDTDVAWDRGVEYDNGYFPRVAMIHRGGLGETVVVAVHQATMSDNSPLLYRVGRVVGSSIGWSQTLEYGRGANPHVVLIYNKGFIFAVEVHENGSGVLESQVGRMEGLTRFEWGPPIPYDNGYFPSISAGPTWLLEVHEGLDAGTLAYRVGSVDLGLLEEYRIDWGDASSDHFDNGWFPSVTATHDGTHSCFVAYEAHQASILTDASPLWASVWHYCKP